MVIFTVPKPFKGEFAQIQEKAILSWLVMRPKPTIVLCGDEEGVQAMTKKYKLFHIRRIRTSKNGIPLLNSVFDEVQKRYKDEIYIYVNSDIIFLDSPTKIVRSLSQRFPSFLAVGRRFEMKSMGISPPQMKKRIKEGNAVLKNHSWMDYFIFTPGVFPALPPFLLGRTFWDKWLLWKCIQKGISVIDVTEDFRAVHQTHSYSFSGTTNRGAVWTGEDALQNIVSAGGWSHSADISSAQYKLVRGRLVWRGPQTTMGSLFRRAMDRIPALWPLFLHVRLIRQQIGSIMDKK